MLVAELAFQESDIIGRLKEKAELIKLISRSEPEPEPEEGHQVLQRGTSTSWLVTLISWVDYMVPSIWEASRPSPLPRALRSFRRGGDGALRVVSVWGMGGMGKSSLARMVHNDPALLDEFDCDAWVTVPHLLDNPEMWFRRRLRNELGLAHDQNVQDYLRDKRYLVIVDDLLDTDEWENIWQVFPHDNRKGSRIIVTTRREDVARHCTREGNGAEGNELIYKLEPLKEAESMNLLCRKPYEVPQSKIRHLAVSRWKRRDEKLQSIDLAYIRSLTIFGEYPESLNSQKMRLLRVLDLEDTINLKNDDLKHIGDLRHLRYLGLRGTDISNIPSSLQNLRYLETLDIQDTQVTQLPGGVAKLEKLRYLLAGFKFTKDLLQKMRESGTKNHEAIRFGNIEACLCYNSSECCKVFNVDEFSLRAPEGIEKLKNLHTLGAVNFGNGSGVAGSLKKLTNLSNLCKLGVTGLTGKEGNELCNSIGELSQLQRLELRSDSLKFLGRWNEPLVPRHLVSLRLCGNLTRLPEWISSLNSLVEVKLLGTRLEQGDIVRLENLRNLALLGLWENSYIGDSLRFFTGTFPKLKFLDIEGLDKIKKVQIKKGAMPELEQLWVNKCPSLHDDSSGLSGVPYLLNLNELLLKKCGDKEDLINILQRQVNRHKKRPRFYIGKSILQTNPALPS
ncbi:hypothetical protein EJB05_42349, partial [Eragrostis curvula]